MKQLLLAMLIWLWTPLVLALPYELVEDGIYSSVANFELNGSHALVLQGQRATIWTREPLRQTQKIELGTEGSCEAFLYGAFMISKCAHEAGYKVWDPMTGKTLSEHGMDGFGTSHTKIYHQENRLAYSESYPVFKIWNPDTGALSRVIKPAKWPQVWKHNNQLLALAYQQEIELWNIKTGQIQLRLATPQSSILDLYLGQDRLAVSYDSGKIEIYKLDGTLIESLNVERIPASVDKVPSENSAWKETGEIQRYYPIHPRYKPAARFSHAFEQISLQGEWIAGISLDPALPGVTLYNLKTQKTRTLFSERRINRIELAYPWLIADNLVYNLPDNREGILDAEKILPRQGIFLDRQGQELRVRNLGDFKTKYRLTSQQSPIKPAYEGGRLATAEGNRILLHSLESSPKILSLWAGGDLLGLALTSDALISQSIDDQMRLWDLDTNRLIATIPVPATLAAAALSQTWLALATKESDFQNLHLFSPQSGDHQFSLDGPERPTERLGFASNQIWSWSDYKLQIWDLEMRQLVHEQGQGQSPWLRGIYPDSGVILQDDSSAENNESFLHWNPLQQRFIGWQPSQEEIRQFVQSDARLSRSNTPEVFKQGRYIPFAPDVSQARDNLWWHRNGQLYLVQTFDNLLRVEKTDLSNGQRELLYSGNASEVSVLDANEERVLLRKRDKGLIRIDWTSGKARPWLDDYEPPVNAVTGAPQDYILNEQLFQLESMPEKQGQNAQTRISVWDLRTNRLKHRFTSVDIIADIKAQFLSEHVILTGKSDYEQDQTQLQAWSLSDGKLLTERTIGASGCDQKLAAQPQLKTIWAEQISPEKARIQICDYQGRIQSDYELALKAESYHGPYLSHDKFYLPRSDGSIETRSAQTGQMLRRQDTFAQAIRKHNYLFEESRENDGLLLLYTISQEAGGEDTPGPGLSLTGMLDLSNGQLSLHPYSVDILKVTSEQVFLMPRGFPTAQVRRVPRNRLAEAEKFINPDLQPVIYSFPDGLFMMNPDGRFAGYGNYQRYLHLNVDGEMLPWPEAVKRWQATGTDILSGN